MKDMSSFTTDCISSIFSLSETNRAVFVVIFVGNEFLMIFLELIVFLLCEDFLQLLLWREKISCLPIFLRSAAYDWNQNDHDKCKAATL